MSQYSLSTSSPFLKGLNTELNKLVDSTEYTNDELNCMIRANNTRSRRPGMDYEELYKFNNEYLDMSLPDLAFQCIEWTDINSPDEAETYTGYPYIVCQVGGKVIFFHNQGQPYSGHQESFTLNLLGYALDPSSDDYMRKRCKFTAAYGCIFITSEAIKPIYLRTAQDTSEVPAPVTSYASATISVAIRNDGQSSPLDSNTPRRGTARYCYICLNGVRLATVESPSNYAVCSTQIAEAWNAVPAATRLNITATPKYTDGIPYEKGISSVIKGTITAGKGGYPADSITFTASTSHMEGNLIEIFVGVGYQTLSRTGSKVWSESLTFSGTLAGGSNYTYQSQLTLAIRDTYVGANDFLGIADNPTKMSYAHLYNLLNQGWTPKLIADYYNAQSPKTFPGNNLAQQFLKDDKTAAFKPDKAINMTFGNSPAARGHEVLEYFNQRRTYKSNIVAAFGQLVSSIGGVTFNNIVDTSWDLTDPTQANEADALTQVPNVKPRKPYVADICAYAGRIFYLTGDVLLYSQVIAEDITRADKCYTEADPTGEEISDVIETDGGLISLPDIGEGIKLQVVGDSLLVFGTRGNMVISGTANNIFTATAYSAGAVSTVPTQAPDSFVSTEYGVFYWGVTGIVALGIGQNGIESKDLTTEKILTFYGKLTNGQHKACKGIYSASKKKIYWFYPSDEALPRRLDLCLVYDIQRDAFCPQQIVAGEGIPEIVGGLQLKVPFKAYKNYPIYATFEKHSTDPVYKYTTATTGIPAREQQNFTPAAGGQTEYVSTNSSKLTFPVTGTYDIVTKFLPNIDRTSYTETSGPIWFGDGYLSNTMLSFGRDATGFFIAHNGVTKAYFNRDKQLWIRITCNGTKMNIYILNDSDEGYTPDTLPAVSEWSVVATNVNDFAIGSVCSLGGLHEMPWYWRSFKNLTTGEASVTNIPAMEVVYYMSKPVLSSTTIYSNPEMTVSAGTAGDIVNDGNSYRVRDCYDLVKSYAGIDRDIVKVLIRNTNPYATFIRYMDAQRYSLRNTDVVSYESTDIFEDTDLDTYKSAAGHIVGYYPGVITDVSELNNAKTDQLSVQYMNGFEGDVEIVDDNGYRILADTPLDTEEFNYESSILLCLDPAESKVTFGDFRNNYMRDWAEGDRTGSGYEFKSYMISHPVNSQDFIRSKTMPYLFSYFKRTETGKLVTGAYVYPSHCQGSVRWDWRTDGVNGKWDSPNELYRFRDRTLLSQGYVTNKTNIRGIGRAFQIKLEGIKDDNFIVEALGFNLCKDERI